jgi:uncharacterized SAM-binding protein YcdF (DUF218 family)
MRLLRSATGGAARLSSKSKAPASAGVDHSLTNRTAVVMSSSAHPPQAIWGLLTRKERLGLSRRGWLIGFTAVLLVFSLFWFRVYPFLAVTHRVDTNILVVEGWVHEYAIRAAVEEFRRGSYQRIFTTGGPVEGPGGYTNDYNTSASVGADLLRKNGLRNGSMQMVPSRVMDHDRTYGSAVALRNWFREHNMPVSGIDVVTEDLHARRTRLLFQKALGDKVAVGVIAIPNPDYDAEHWWRYSAGVKDVVSETAAYVYASLLFCPSASSSDDKRPGTSQSSR